MILVLAGGIAASGGCLITETAPPTERYTDGQGSLTKRQSWIEGVLFVSREDAEKPMPFADASLECADLACVRQEYFWAGQIDADVHGCCL